MKSKWVYFLNRLTCISLRTKRRLGVKFCISLFIYQYDLILKKASLNSSTFEQFRVKI